MRVFIIILIVLQLIGIVSSMAAAIVEIETIVGTGPAFSLAGVLISALCYRSNTEVGFYFGLAVPTIAVLCFAAIFGFQWSPADAQVPIGCAICGFGVLAIPLGLFALLEGRSADLAKRPVRLQFGIAVLLGLMFVVSVPLGLLRTGQQLGAAIGILVSYGVVAGFVVRRFYAGRPDI